MKRKTSMLNTLQCKIMELELKSGVIVKMLLSDRISEEYIPL